MRCAGGVPARALPRCASAAAWAWRSRSSAPERVSLSHNAPRRNQMSEMKQKVVLVTGGMGGLGETISTKMVDAGYKLAVTYSPGNKSHAEWVAQMAERGYQILAVPCDVADYDSCARAVSQV